MFWDIDELVTEKIAVVDENRAITFGQVIEDAEKFESILGGRCVILMLCENSVGAYTGYFAFTAIECVVIVLEESVKRDFCQRMIEKYKPQYIWAQNSWKETLGLKSVFEIYDYYLLKTDYEPYKLSNGIGIVLSTSGSTGDVKCVQLGYDGIREHAKALSEEIGFTKDDSAITTMPMAFVYTLSFINFHIMKGATLIMTNQNIMEKQFWKLFYEYHPTCISGLTLHYEMLDLMKFFEKDCKYMKIFTQGGDVFGPQIRKKVREYCKKYNKKCFILYGQTETGGTCGSLPLEEDRGKNCIGKAIHSGRFELENADAIGNGELVYYGKCAMLGYVTAADDFNKMSLRNEGRVETGDIVNRSSDGFYFIIGRKKRIVKLHGRRVSLDDIESYVKGQLGTEECACIGGKEKVWVIIAAMYGKEKEEWLKEKLEDFLEISSIMINIVYVNSLIRNETGKILYAQLEDLIEKQYGDKGL